MTKILATSDLHGNLPEVPDCDILLIGGDICPDFAGGAWLSTDGAAQAGWLDTTFRNWLEGVPAKHIVAIAGNHDFVFEHPDKIPDLPWIYLNDNTTEVEGLTIYGNPMVPNLRSWAFHGGLDCRVYPHFYTGMPRAVDILLIHGPPHMYGDKLVGGGRYGNDNPEHVGDKTMAGWLFDQHVEPKVIVCGHIHESAGWYRHPKFSGGIYNVAMVDENYVPRDVECVEIAI